MAFIISTSGNHVVPQWSLVVGLADYVVKPGNQSGVLVCRVEAWSTPCFMGLYILNGNGVNGGLNGKGVNGGYVLVGNGNGWTRVGLNGNHVRLYGVVASLPIYIWLPLLTLYFALIAYILLREVERGYVQPLRDPRVLGVAILMAISINSVLVGALYVDQATPRYSLPGISVEWGFNLENSTVSAKLLLSGFYILQSATCSYSPIGANTSYPLETIIVNGDTVVATIPSTIYEQVYKSRVLDPIPPIPANLSVYEAIPVKCRFTLDKGVFEASYLAVFYWRDLIVRVVDSSVLVDNSNPVGVNASIYIVDLERGRLVNSTSVFVEPLSSVWIDLGLYGAGVYRVIVQYNLLGLVRTRVVETVVS